MANNLPPRDVSEKNKTPLPPRGIRNNNPLNIRRNSNNHWCGTAEIQTDPSFVQFRDMIYGVRAAFMLLRIYMTTYRLTTIRNIISRWAPQSENDTEAYINRVSRMTGIPTDKTLTFNNSRDMVAIVDAMIVVECGEHISQTTIARAYQLSFINIQ